MTAKDEAVVDCTNKVLISHGWSSPIDPNGTMGGYYKYKQPLMIAFHNQVAICLASKGYDYEYPHTNEYMARTLAMTLLALYGAIGSQTKVGRPHLERIAADIQNLELLSATAAGGVALQASLSSLPKTKAKKTGKKKTAAAKKTKKAAKPVPKKKKPAKAGAKSG